MAEAQDITEDLDSSNSVEIENEGFDEIKVAKDGINLMLNNNFEEAFQLFQKYKYDTVVYVMIDLWEMKEKYVLLLINIDLCTHNFKIVC